MAFQKEAARTPADVGQIRVSLAALHPDAAVPTLDGSPASKYSGNISFDVLDSSGDVIGTRNYDLFEHLSPQQETIVRNFLDSLRTKAKAEAV